MIDDDLGQHFDFQQQQRQQQRDQRAGAATAAAGAAAGAQAQAQQLQPQPQWPAVGAGRPGLPAAVTAGDFPALSEVAAAAGPSPRGGIANSTNGSAAPAPSAAAELVKATAVCGCGRRQMHLVVRQGSPVPALPCDRECEAAARRSRLADAFGVEAPERHVPVFDRHRAVSYSPALLQVRAGARTRAAGTRGSAA